MRNATQLPFLYFYSEETSFHKYQHQSSINQNKPVWMEIHAGIKLTKTIFLLMCAAISAWAQNVNYTMPRTEFNFLVYSCSGGSSLVRCGTAKTARNIVRIILRYGGREREGSRERTSQCPSSLILPTSRACPNCCQFINVTCTSGHSLSLH